MSNIKILRTMYRADKGNVILFYNIQSGKSKILSKGNKRELKDFEDLNELLEQLIKYIKNL